MTRAPAIAPPPLPADRLYAACDVARLGFKTTADLEPLERFVGQERAVEAVRFAIAMPHQGYNLFAFGPQGTGKSSLVRRFLEMTAAERPVPDDWCYVHNFAEPHKPRALRLPAGHGRPFAQDMADLVEDLRSAIPAAFESEEYRNRRQVIEEQYKERHEEVFGDLQKRAADRDVALVRTPVGLALAPMKDGEVLNSEEFKKLTEKEQLEYRDHLEELQHELEKILSDIPKWEKEQREQIRKLNRDITEYAVGHLIDALRTQWKDMAPVIGHLDVLEHDVVDNAADFLPNQEQQQPEAVPMPVRGASGENTFRRYRVNVLVDNGGPRRGAPVREEDHPTLPAIVGRIEHLSQFGTLVTDFNLIKPGALHEANGGFLLLDARRVLIQPFAWEGLKRALRSRRIRIESAAEAYGLSGTSTLDPEPVPLDVKVVLIGEPEIYYLLSDYDPEFRELFKVAADFDDRMPRNEAHVLHYARLIAALGRKEGLRPLNAKAVARVVEYGSRLADDSERLSTHMGSIVDLVREADYQAAQVRRRIVTADHVEKAIKARIYRSDRISQRIQEEIERGTLLIETAGERVGQINGLAVYELNDYRFGKPARIACRVRPGKGEVVDIEREVALGGPIHSKGVLILSAFLNQRYGAREPLSLSATLVFEQSYGGIEGDSASSAELYALLSAIADIPIRQEFAVTGSVDSFGRVQAIGGVNEKIEGFFDVCKARGLTGTQGVLIPAANVKHLMLREDVRAAVAAGRFRVHAVASVDEGIELLTGIPAGSPEADGGYPLGSVNRAVAGRLARLARGLRALAGPPPEPRARPGRKEK